MNIKEQLNLLEELSTNLIAAIEDESWDDALHYSHEWSRCMHDLFNCLSSDQLALYRSELIKIDKFRYNNPRAK